MRLELELGLVDAPGVLAGVLESVAEHGANILSVVHRHEAADGGEVPVILVLELPEESALGLVANLTRHHRILRMDQDGGPSRGLVILTGHVVQSGLDKLLEPVSAAGARVDRLDARMAGRQEPSAVLVDLSAPTKDALVAGLAALRAGAAGAGLAIIEGLEDAHA